MTNCCTAVRMLFECRSHYSLEFFDFIDYINANANIAGAQVEGFTLLIKSRFVVPDQNWKELFYKYSQIENGCTKHRTVKLGAQVLGVLINSMSCSLVMDIVELAITLNKCEEIKKVLKANLSFSTIEEFKDLVTLQC